MPACFFLLTILIFAPPFPVSAAEPAARARLIFTGDILLSRQVEREMLETQGFPWKHLVPLFSEADFIMGNLEGAVGKAGDCPAALSEKRLCFAVREEFVSGMARAGFAAVGIENNHSNDLGLEGKKRTREVLGKAGVAALDFEDSPHFSRVNGINISLITFDGTALGSVPQVSLKQKLRLAGNLSNLVIVFIHWGGELRDWVTEEQEQMAKWLTDNGADLIVGHHPHVIQKTECLSGKPVYYSLGNHLFDQKYPATKEGMLADCSISGGKLRCGAVRTEARRKNSFFPEPVDTEKSIADTLSACAVGLRDTINIDGYSLRPVVGKGWINSANMAIEAVKDGRTAWQTPARKIFSIETLALGNGENLLLTIEKHYSPIDKERSPRPYVYKVKPNMLAAKWRGSALAWPLLDAVVFPGFLCALHRGDSFLLPNPATKSVRTAVYRWNGFGFSGIHNPAEAVICRGYFNKEAEASGLQFVDL